MRGDEEAERALALGAPHRAGLGHGQHQVRRPGHRRRRPRARVRRAPRRDGREAPCWSRARPTRARRRSCSALLRQLRADLPSAAAGAGPALHRAGRTSAYAGARVAASRLGCDRGRPPPPQADVVLLDTIGELGRSTGWPTLVFVGGSFTARGGQNILEPAAAGKPVLFGPNMENFADSVQVLLGRGGLQVKDARPALSGAARAAGQPEPASQSSERWPGPPWEPCAARASATSTSSAAVSSATPRRKHDPKRILSSCARARSATSCWPRPSCGRCGPPIPTAHIDWLVDGHLVPLLVENPHLTRASPHSPGGVRSS